MSSKRSTIRLVILESGENVIGFTNGDGHETTVEKPVLLMPTQENKVAFIPYLQFSEETSAVFKQSTVRHVLTPRSDLLDHYDSQFGSGLVLA